MLSISQVFSAQNDVLRPEQQSAKCVHSCTYAYKEICIYLRVFISTDTSTRWTQ